MSGKTNRRDFLRTGTFVSASLLTAGTNRMTAEESASGARLRVGAYAMDITPETSVAVNGGFEPRIYDTACDRLHARVLVIDDGTDRFAFATLDVCLFDSAFADRVIAEASEKSGIPKEKISLSATHTHYAPGLNGFYAEKNKDYIEGLVHKTVDAFPAAIERLQPARFGWTTAREPRHVFCRRILMKPGTAWDEPAAFTDAEHNLAQMNPPKESPNIVSRTSVPDQNIYILAFETPDGKPLALLANYSTHYAGDPSGVSSDYFGVFAEKIKEMLGGGEDFVAMMTNGTSGDCNCIDFLHKDQPAFDWKIVGTHVAEKVRDAYPNIRFNDNAVVRSRRTSLTLGVRKPTPEQVAEAKAYLEEVKENPQTKATTKSYAERTLEQVSLNDTREIPLQAVRIGDFGICTIPNEVFSFTGHDLRAYTPLACNAIVGLANGYNGYLPPTDQFELGGYTTWRGTSYLEKTAEPKIRTALLALLGELAAETPRL